jgi:parallel beta-helix repeat protein
MDGVQLESSSSNLIVNNTAESNTYDGMELSYSNSNTISNNSINGNDNGILLSYSDNTISNNREYGICVVKNSEKIAIKGNAVKQNKDAGIYLNASTACQILGDNTIGPENGNGVQIDSCDAKSWNSITNATIQGNFDNGIVVNYCQYIEIGDKGAKNTSDQNKGFGIYITNCQCQGGEDNGIILKANIISQNDSSGVFVGNSRHIKIYNNNQITENKQHGIHLFDCKLNRIEGNKIQSNHLAGIKVTDCQRDTDGTIDIRNNVISSNKDGVYLYNSCNTHIWSGSPPSADLVNIISNNRSAGIRLKYCECKGNNYNFIGNGKIEDNEYGIFLESSNNQRIGSEHEGVVVRRNKNAGIYLSKSEDIWVKNSQIGPRNNMGIFLEYCECENNNPNLIYGNKVSESLYYGIYVKESSGNQIGQINKPKNEIFDNYYAGIYLLHCNSESESGLANFIENNDIESNSALGANGITAVLSNNNTIRKNWIEKNTKNGIFLDEANKNQIYENYSISVNGNNGIHLTRSNQNKIFDNEEIMENGNNGVLLENSNNNTIEKNEISANKGNGVALEYSEKTEICTNKISKNDKGGTYLDHSNDNKIWGNQIIANKGDGLTLQFSENNLITPQKRLMNFPKNEINKNEKNGVYLFRSNSNILRQIDVMYNKGNGIYLKNCSKNKVLGKQTIKFNDENGIALFHSKRY